MIIVIHNYKIHNNLYSNNKIITRPTYNIDIDIVI